MGRILAIDYGRKRIGIAVSDPLKIIASALDTVDNHRIWEFLHDYMSKENVELIVIGYPVQMNNKPSEIVSQIDPFMKALNKKYPHLNVVKFDERFTSKMAFQTMIDAGTKKKDRRKKETLDKISATIILQSYMESIK